MGLTNVSEVAASEDDTCARSSEGMSCWGVNAHGEIGDGTINESDTPVIVPGLQGNELVAGGTSQYEYACAITNKGPMCWGSNFFGQLGDGTQVDRHTPTPMKITNVGMLAPGGARTCGLDPLSTQADGLAWCVGTAPLGDGTNTGSNDPVHLPGVSANQIVAGDDYACALYRNGQVVCWGNSGGAPAPMTLTPTHVVLCP
jgi:alpha-tubulin suppressor-like RCC1 family protein